MLGSSPPRKGFLQVPPPNISSLSAQSGFPFLQGGRGGGDDEFWGAQEVCVTTTLQGDLAQENFGI